MKPTLLTTTTLSVTMLVTLASTGGSQNAAVAEDFAAGRFETVARRLLAHRIDHEGTLPDDFMLAVSSCRMSNRSFQELGGYLLMVIPRWYEPLSAEYASEVRRHSVRCRYTGITEAQAMAGVSGSSDAPGARLDPRRSNKGNGLPPPTPGGPVVVPPPSGSSIVPGMSAPLRGTAYLQADYRDAMVDSPQACATLCVNEPRCRAMTYIPSQQRCWLKDSVPATAPSGEMISAYEVTP